MICNFGGKHSYHPSRCGSHIYIYIYIYITYTQTGGLCSLMAIIIENGQGDMSSNPEWDCSHFT